MKLWTVEYSPPVGADDVTEWQAGKSAATNRAIELGIPVRVRERELPDNREDMAKWLNDNHVKPWTPVAE